MNVSVFFDPKVAEISDVVIDVSLALSTVLYPLMLWLIFYRSRLLGRYRWYIFANVTLCYAFDVALTLVKPVFLGPFYGWYLQGFLPANGEFALVVLTFWKVTMINMDLSVVASLFYRYSQAFYGPFRDFFESRKAYAAYVVIAISCSTMPFVPFFLGRFSSREEMVEYTERFSPALIAFTTYNGFYAFERTAAASAFLLNVVVIFFGFLTVGNILCAFFLARLRSKKFRQTQSKSGYRLQMMLIRIISIQLLLGYTLLLLPALFAYLLIALSVPHSGPVATMLVTSMSFHAALDYVVVCYFVVPYRRAIAEVITRIVRRKSPGAVSVQTTRVTAFESGRIE